METLWLVNWEELLVEREWAMMKQIEAYNKRYLVKGDLLCFSFALGNNM